MARRRPGQKAHKFARLLTTEHHYLYRTLMSDNDHAPSFVIGATDLPSFDGDHAVELLDTLTYLPDDILTKVDRASMSVSLEVRVPLLDPDVFSFAWSLPPHLRVHEGSGKIALRQVLARHVPPDLFERPKMGFGVPVSAWLRGPLRSWADQLLDPALIREQALLNETAVGKLWSDHQRGSLDNGSQLWPILMLQAWLQERR
jgi:asparagine synthase (glutamine-hydrolysing)